ARRRLRGGQEEKLASAGDRGGEGEPPRRVAFAAALVAVHPGVRLRQQRFVALAVVWVDGDAGADRQRHALAGRRLDDDAADGILQLGALVLGLSGRAS